MQVTWSRVSRGQWQISATLLLYQQKCCSNTVIPKTYCLCIVASWLPKPEEVETVVIHTCNVYRVRKQHVLLLSFGTGSWTYFFDFDDCHLFFCLCKFECDICLIKFCNATCSLVFSMGSSRWMAGNRCRWVLCLSIAAQLSVGNAQQNVWKTMSRSKTVQTRDKFKASKNQHVCGLAVGLSTANWGKQPKPCFKIVLMRLGQRLGSVGHLSAAKPRCGSKFCSWVGHETGLPLDVLDEPHFLNILNFNLKFPLQQTVKLI